MTGGWKGISEAVLDAAGVEVVNGEVRIPYRTYDGWLWATRIFKGDRTWWDGLNGKPLIPYTAVPLSSFHDPRLSENRFLLVTEGESDALAVHEAFGDGDVEVLAAPGAHTWRDEWTSYLEPYGSVLVLGDGDEAGQLFNWRVRRSFPAAAIVTLPAGEDVRSILQRDGAYGLDPYIEDALSLHSLEGRVLGGGRDAA
jgi:Toprim domain-containing protein